MTLRSVTALACDNKQLCAQSAAAAWLLPSPLPHGKEKHSRAEDSRKGKPELIWEGDDEHFGKMAEGFFPFLCCKVLSNPGSRASVK